MTHPIFYHPDNPQNIAFIDGQNLYMGTCSSEIPWKIDLFRFREYLARKYQVKKAYYYMGNSQENAFGLYQKIQEAGFIVCFRKHTAVMVGKKKGNVDADIVFDIMKRLYKKEDFKKIVLVSGDGDYRMLVDFLIEENRFEKILFPNRRFASSLYREISHCYFVSLDTPEIQEKIMIQKNEKGALGS
ncbi:MAG: NYN domain-containing protein [Candidatus Peregrinibacteria bacterium]